MEQMQGTIENSPAVDASTAGLSQSVGLIGHLMMMLFIISMLVPVWIQVGSVKLMPHRIVLILVFVPLLLQLLMGKAGKIRSFDILMMLSAAWAVLAILVNGSAQGNGLLQSMGIYVLESFGAYLLGRMTIRSAEDFIRFSRIFLAVLMILVPFAIAEAITHRAILLEMIPKSAAINQNTPRWGLRRAQTVFAHPILFGVFCSAGLGLFWYVLRSGVMRYGGALLACAGTFFSLSSGALVSITFQILFIAWERVMKQVQRRWMIFSILAALAYVLIDLLSNRTPFHVLISYATFNADTAYNRIRIWEYGIQNVWMNPWFGLGENITSWVRPSWMSSSADNYWLLLAMQYGIPCFLFVAAALAIIIRRVGLAPLADPVEQACRRGYLTAMGGLIVAGGTVHYWHGVMAFVMFFFGAGIWLIEAGVRSRAKTAPFDMPQVDASPRGVSDPLRGAGLIYTRQSAHHDRRRRTSPATTRAKAR